MFSLSPGRLSEPLAEPVKSGCGHGAGNWAESTPPGRLESEARCRLQVGTRGTAGWQPGLRLRWGWMGSGVGLREAKATLIWLRGPGGGQSPGGRPSGSVFTPSRFMVDFLCGRRRRCWGRLRSPLLGARCMPVFVAGGGCVPTPTLQPRSDSCRLADEDIGAQRGQVIGPKSPSCWMQAQVQVQSVQSPAHWTTHPSPHPHLPDDLPRALLDGAALGPGWGGVPQLTPVAFTAPGLLFPQSSAPQAPGLQGCRQPARGLCRGTEAPGRAPGTCPAPQRWPPSSSGCLGPVRGWGRGAPCPGEGAAGSALGLRRQRQQQALNCPPPLCKQYGFG